MSNEMMPGQIGAEMRKKNCSLIESDESKWLGHIGQIMTDEDYAGYLRGLIIDKAANGARANEINRLLNRLRAKE